MTMRRLSTLVLAFAVLLPLGCGDDDASPKTDAAAGSGGSGGGGSGGGGSGGGGAGGGGAGGGGAGGSAAGDGGAVDGGGLDAAAGAGVDGGAGSGGDASATSDGGGSSGDVASMGVMSFFVTSRPIGMGGNLGGLRGADKHCDDLAKAVSAQKKQWVAYLSTAVPMVHARERIGQGPWYNQKGQLFAANLDRLHPSIDPATDRAGYIAAKPADALFMDETGAAVPATQHDILTGSDAQGRVLVGKTCADWTSEGAGGGTNVARLGHSDTPSNTAFSASWNSAHDSQGCGQANLIPTGGNGRLYCFATD